MRKRGQTAVFVIVAVLIIVSGVLVYFFYPEIKTFVSGDVSPSSFLESCVEEDLENSLNILLKQGGYANPEGFILHDGFPVKYLCYNAQYYLPCNVQQPLIKAKFENELEDMLSGKVNECVNELTANYESNGYSVSGLNGNEIKVEFVPEKMMITVRAPMVITKDTTQTFREFTFQKASKIYSLLMISTSIIDYESTYGDSETTLYLAYYPNLKIQKNKLGDGSTIYTVEDVTTNEAFTFASRSVAWPGGYGATA